MQIVQFLKNLGLAGVGLAGGALVLFYAFNQLRGTRASRITDPVFSRGG